MKITTKYVSVSNGCCKIILDPPYYKAPCYDNNLELHDYSDMASILAKIRSRLILSIKDHPEMQKTFDYY